MAATASKIENVPIGFFMQAAFPFKRLGIGAFKIALESIFNR